MSAKCTRSLRRRVASLIFRQFGGADTNGQNKEFEKLEGADLTLGADGAINAFMGFAMTDYFLLAVLVLICISFLDERKKGLWSVVHAVPYGRLRTVRERAEALREQGAQKGFARWLALFAGAMLTLFISSRMKRMEVSYIAASGIMLLPSLLYCYIGIEPFKHISFVLPVTATDLLISHQGAIGTVLLAGVGMVAACIASVWMVKRKCKARRYSLKRASKRRAARRSGNIPQCSASCKMKEL